MTGCWEKGESPRRRVSENEKVETHRCAQPRLRQTGDCGVARSSQRRGTGDFTRGVISEDDRDAEGVRGARSKDHVMIVSNTVDSRTRVYPPYARPGYRRWALLRHVDHFGVDAACYMIAWIECHTTDSPQPRTSPPPFAWHERGDGLARAGMLRAERHDVFRDQNVGSSIVQGKYRVTSRVGGGVHPQRQHDGCERWRRQSNHIEG